MQRSMKWFNPSPLKPKLNSLLYHHRNNIRDTETATTKTELYLGVAFFEETEMLVIILN